MGIDETIGPYLDKSTGSVKEVEANIQYLSLGLAGRAQAGFDWRLLTLSPYLEYGADLLARSLVTVKNDETYDSGKMEKGAKNRRLSFGVNLYFNFNAISVGLGADFARLSGDLGSSIKANDIHLILRSGT